MSVTLSSYDVGRNAAHDCRIMRDMLEGMIDSGSLEVVLRELATVCDGKADHLIESWQDGAAAMPWLQMRDILNRASSQAGRQKI